MSTISTRKHYTTEFKEQILELIAAGKPIPEVAREFEISTSMLYRWSQPLHRSQGGSAARQAEGLASEADALRAARRELARLRMENEILKKAAIILGTKPQANSER